ncbi:MAG: ABC transporter ATP-binding protein [Solirubrobacterales bacterium]
MSGEPTINQAQSGRAPAGGRVRAAISIDAHGDEASSDQLLGAMHRVLLAHHRCDFELSLDGASVEGPAADVFEIARELHALPTSIGMPDAHTTIDLTDERQADNVIQGPGTWIPHTPPSNAPLAVEVRGLKKTYVNGDVSVTALQWIDLEIQEGEFVAVMGPSGSGKSTLMHILGALETPSGGVLRIGNTDYASLSEAEQTLFRRDHIGFVFQFFNLFGTLTAEENVMLPSLIAGEKAEDLRGRARDLLSLVNLDKRAEHLPSQLSGGEQQRVSVARSLMREPELILADEPTGNLDSRNSAAVLDLLTQLQREQNRTILMVTHDPVAASRATRVVFLRDGRFDAEVPGGDPNQILDYFRRLGEELGH